MVWKFLAALLLCACDAQLTVDQKNALLLRHNQLRCIHGAPPLVWNDAVAASAQSWADRGIFEHSPDSNKIAAPAGPAGENVGTAEWDATGGDAQAWTYFMGDIVEGWHDEVRMRPSSPVQPSTEAGVSPRVVGEMLRERRLHDGDRRILRRGGPLHLHGLERSARRLFRGVVRWLGCDRASSGSRTMGCGLGVTKGTSPLEKLLVCRYKVLLLSEPTLVCPCISLRVCAGRKRRSAGGRHAHN